MLLWALEALFEYFDTNVMWLSISLFNKHLFTRISIGIGYNGKPEDNIVVTIQVVIST